MFDASSHLAWDLSVPTVLPACARHGFTMIPIPPCLRRLCIFIAQCISAPVATVNHDPYNGAFAYSGQGGE